MTSTPPPIHTSDTPRSASTNVVPPVKISQAISPGIPLPAQPDSASTNADFLAIKLPDLSRPPPNAPVQVVSFPFRLSLYGIAKLFSSISSLSTNLITTALCPRFLEFYPTNSRCSPRTRAPQVACCRRIGNSLRRRAGVQS